MAGRRTVSTLEVRIAGNIRDALQGMDEVGTKAQKLGRDLRRTGFQLSEQFTLPLTLAGGAAIKVAADFEESMNRVRGLTGATGSEFEALEQQARDMGRTSAFSASQAADAMGFLAMAGFDTREILATLPGVLDLAAAGQMDLAETADIASNILSGYKMDVEDLGRVNDVLVKTFSSANVDLRQLAESFKTVGPIATDVGLEFEEVAAVLGVMGEAGVRGQEAGTALRVGLGRLLNPVPNVIDELNSLGLSIQDVNPEMNSLTEIIGALNGAGADAGNILKIFGQRGAALAPLIGAGADAVENLHGVVLDSSGSAERMGDIMMEGLTGAWRDLKSSAEAVAISFSQSGVGGVVTQLTTWLADLFKAAAQLNPEIFQMAAAAGAVLAAAGPLMIAAGSLSSLFALLVSPVGAVVASLAAVAAGTVYVVNNWDELRVLGTKIWRGIQDAVFTAVRNILTYYEDLPLVGDKIKGWRKEFDRFADQSLANTQESLEAQQRAMEKTADEADKLAAETAGLTSETGDYADAAQEARNASDQVRDALDDQKSSADQLRGSVRELSVETRRMFEDITRRITGEAFLPSDQIERTMQDIAEGRTDLRGLGEAGKDAGEEAAEGARGIGDALQQGLKRGVRNFESLKQVGMQVLSALKSQILDTLISGLFGAATGGSGGFLAGLFGGGRQHGGPVRPGRAYLVGEAGEELFVPPRAGRIVPHGATAAAMRGGPAQVTLRPTPEHTRNVREMREALQNFGPAGQLAAVSDAGFQRFLRAAFDVAADQGYEPGSS